MNKCWKYLLYPPVHVDEEAMHTHFAGKWVVVTGATSGIGESLVLRLIDAKAKLYLISRNEQKLKALCNAAKMHETEAQYTAIDLSNREQLDILCQQLPSQLPQLSYLFCNAGKSICRTLSDSEHRIHDFDRTTDLNYRSLVALSLALMPSLRKTQEGRIVYTSSVSSLCPYFPGWSAYHASKCAANAWCTTANREYKSLKVKVQIAYMPLVHTPMSDVTPQYKQLPAYSSDEAACILLRLAMSPKFSYRPWWARVLK